MNTPGTAISRVPELSDWWAGLRRILAIGKLRIGITIAYTAAAGAAVTPGPFPGTSQVTLFCLTVLLSAATAGAFNQYYERDIDARMARTRTRPFASGELAHGPAWPWLLFGLMALAVVLAGLVGNGVAAFYVLLGAIFYAVVYTVVLKRRTPWNIVIGGLAGSFAVMAGSALVDTELHVLPLLLAVALFLWTPSHFWSLAIAMREQYKTAGIPMLPVRIGDQRTAYVILCNSVLLVIVSLAPVMYGMGALYLACAGSGGLLLLIRNVQLLRNPTRANAMTSFHASLIQIALLLTGAILS